MIYADYNATGPLLPEVREAMAPWLESQFGNAASIHYPLGKQAADAVEQAREQVAGLVGCNPGEVVFTSGGTESCFLALVGAVSALPSPAQIIISAGEHPAVREATYFLSRSPFQSQVRELPLHASGDVRYEAIDTATSLKASVASVMSANNETGVYFDLDKLRGIYANSDVILHTDAVQVIGREQFNASRSPAQLISLSGHKFGAPKGVGALIVKEGVNWISPIPGGGQERGRRGGTVAVPQVVGLGAAAAVAFKQLGERPNSKAAEIRDLFETNLAELIPSARILGADCKRLSNTSSVLIPGTLALDLVRRLGEREICVSAGSACSVSYAEPSHVLRAMGLSTFDALATVRVSFGRTSSALDAQCIATALAESVAVQRRDGEALVRDKMVVKDR